MPDNSNPFEQKVAIIAYAAAKQATVPWKEMISRKERDIKKHGHSLWWIPYVGKSPNFIESVRKRAKLLEEPRKLPVFVVGPIHAWREIRKFRPVRNKPDTSDGDPVRELSEATHVHWLAGLSKISNGLEVTGEWKARDGCGVGSALVLETISLCDDAESQFRTFLGTCRPTTIRAGLSAWLMDSSQEKASIRVDIRRPLVAIGWLKAPDYAVDLDMKKNP